MDYALELLIPILLGLYAGHWLDTKTGKEPLFTLLGVIIGMVLGIGILYKRMIYTQKKNQKSGKNNNNKNP